jgi:hypothetical protein
MALGGTAKTLQKATNVAGNLYDKMDEVIGRLTELETTVKQTSAQVDALERPLAEQRALIDSIAEAEGIEIETVLQSVDCRGEMQRHVGEDASAGDSPLPETQATDTVCVSTDRTPEKTTIVEGDEVTVTVTVTVDGDSQSE